MTSLMQTIYNRIRIDRTSLYVFIVAYSTGMRIGDILALTFNDVDLENRIIHIRHSLDYVKTKQIKSTKNKSSVRDIVFDPLTTTYLSDIIQDRKNLIDCEKINPNGLIFVNRITQLPISWSAIQKALDKLCEQAQVPKITTHGFRHSHVSYLLNHDVYDQYVAERVGHADTTMIKKVYGHVLDELKQESDRKIIDLMNKK